MGVSSRIDYISSLGAVPGQFVKQSCHEFRETDLLGGTARFAVDAHLGATFF